MVLHVAIHPRGGFPGREGESGGRATDWVCCGDAPGGERNIAQARGATVAGGLGNIASSRFAVAAGRLCLAGGNVSVVAGGLFNGALGNYATIAGGWQNLAQAGATVGGGYSNTANGVFSGIQGGAYNEVRRHGLLIPLKYRYECGRYAVCAPTQGVTYNSVGVKCNIDTIVVQWVQYFAILDALRSSSLYADITVQ